MMVVAKGAFRKNARHTENKDRPRNGFPGLEFRRKLAEIAQLFEPDPILQVPELEKKRGSPKSRFLSPSLFACSCQVSAMLRLRGLLEVLPDNKIIEEVHHGLKQDAKKTQKAQRKTARQQVVAVSTPVLSSRDIPHSAAVTKEWWIQHFKSTQSTGCKRKHYSMKHKMSKMWTKVMGPKTWPTVSETVSQKGVAAWQWLLVGYPRARAIATTQGRALPGLDAALFSQLVLPDFILESVDAQVLGASLGHASWAALFYPLEVVRVRENGWRTFSFRSTQATTFFDHVTDPRRWRVIPYRSEMDERRGVVVEQIANPEPLLQAALRRSKCLSYDLLVFVAEFLGLGLGLDPSRQTLLRSLAATVSGDAHFPAAVLFEDEKPPTVAVATLLGDPVFEAAYQEMPDDEKQEFPEVRREQARNRVRQHVLDRARQAARRRPGAPLPKRRVRQRAGLAAGEVLAAPAPAAMAAPQPVALALEAPAAPEPVVPPAPTAPAPLVVEHPPPPPPGRVPRGRAWDQQRRFWIARTHRHGVFEAVTVTCLFHTADGERCNKSFAPGAVRTEAQATAAIKEWCARGLSLPNVAGGKSAHMGIQPRTFRLDEIRSEDELAAVVGGLL